MDKSIEVHSRYDDLVDPKTLKDHPKNRNKHGSDQIERLAKLYSYQGIRHPIIVSKLSGFIVAGHGRKLAAIRAGVNRVPVVYQDFETSEQEYAFIQSDNAVALWAELDLSGINTDLADLGPDFDLDFLGIKNFKMDFSPGELVGDSEAIDFASSITGESRNVILSFTPEEYDEFVTLTRELFEKGHGNNSITELVLTLLKEANEE